MQAANLTPAAPLPTCVEMLPPAERPPGGIQRDPLLALALVPVLEDVVSRLATDGDFEPPHPDASNRRLATAIDDDQRALERIIASKTSTPVQSDSKVTSPRPHSTR
jgi:hypothetical protein